MHSKVNVIYIAVLRMCSTRRLSMLKYLTWLF